AAMISLRAAGLMCHLSKSPAGAEMHHSCQPPSHVMLPGGPEHAKGHATVTGKKCANGGFFAAGNPAVATGPELAGCACGCGGARSDLRTCHGRSAVLVERKAGERGRRAADHDGARLAAHPCSSHRH